jgi:hypothetical protein
VLDEKGIVGAGTRRTSPLGLCATFYTLKRQGEEYFGGLREAVLERDGYQRENFPILATSVSVILTATSLLLKFY